MTARTSLRSWAEEGFLNSSQCRKQRDIAPHRKPLAERSQASNNMRVPKKMVE